MGLRKLKPTTPGQRHKVANDFAPLTTTANKPEKSLVIGKKKNGGRNNTGKMTMRNIGGGHKQKLELLISKEINMEFLLLLKHWNMIQEELLLLH